MAAPVASGLGPLEINGTFIVELIAFLIMFGILARWVYPRIIAAAEARQRQIEEQLAAAERARQEAEARLNEIEARLQDARRQAQEVIDAAARSADQLRQELRRRAEEDARRLIERAEQAIAAARQQALDSVRVEVADMVVQATERVIGEVLDRERHRKLIESAIEEVTIGER